MLLLRTYIVQIIIIGLHKFTELMRCYDTIGKRCMQCNKLILSVWLDIALTLNLTITHKSK